MPTTPVPNEWDDSIDMYAPCQPIGCDHGRHLDGCVYAAADEPFEPTTPNHEGDQR